MMRESSDWQDTVGEPAEPASLRRWRERARAILFAGMSSIAIAASTYLMFSEVSGASGRIAVTVLAATGEVAILIMAVIGWFNAGEIRLQEIQQNIRDSHRSIQNSATVATTDILNSVESAVEPLRQFLNTVDIARLTAVTSSLEQELREVRRALSDPRNAKSLVPVGRDILTKELTDRLDRLTALTTEVRGRVEFLHTQSQVATTAIQALDSSVRQQLPPRLAALEEAVVIMPGRSVVSDQPARTTAIGLLREINDRLGVLGEHLEDSNARQVIASFNRNLDAVRAEISSMVGALNILGTGLDRLDERLRDPATREDSVAIGREVAIVRDMVQTAAVAFETHMGESLRGSRQLSHLGDALTAKLVEVEEKLGLNPWRLVDEEALERRSRQLAESSNIDFDKVRENARYWSRLAVEDPYAVVTLDKEGFISRLLPGAWQERGIVHCLPGQVAAVPFRLEEWREELRLAGEASTRLFDVGSDLKKLSDGLMAARATEETTNRLMLSVAWAAILDSAWTDFPKAWERLLDDLRETSAIPEPTFSPNEFVRALVDLYTSLQIVPRLSATAYVQQRYRVHAIDDLGSLRAFFFEHVAGTLPQVLRSSRSELVQSALTSRNRLVAMRNEGWKTWIYQLFLEPFMQLLLKVAQEESGLLPSERARERLAAVCLVAESYATYLERYRSDYL